MDDMYQFYDDAVSTGWLQRDPAQENVLDALERIRAELNTPVMRGFLRKTPEPVKGLYLWGGVGRGKSMLTDLLFDCVTAPKLRTHFHAFMQRAHDDMRKAQAKGIPDTIGPLAEDLHAQARLLVLDEMQITDITDAMIVGRLFEKLLSKGMTVVTTSNRPPDDLYKNGLNRQLFLPFIDIMNTQFEVRELASPTDHRQGRLSGAQVYFIKNTPDAQQGFNAVWSNMTDNRPADPLVLRLKGRELRLPEYALGAARATFYDLCGMPLGPADYLAIAQNVRALFISDIPCLGRSNFNEAKRFVTLIDTLYEAGTRLICLAAAEPDKLYTEGEGAFEFARTASRLNEMQSAAWAS